MLQFLFLDFELPLLLGMPLTVDLRDYDTLKLNVNLDYLNSSDTYVKRTDCSCFLIILENKPNNLPRYDQPRTQNYPMILYL